MIGERRVADYVLVGQLGPGAFGDLWVAKAPDRVAGYADAAEHIGLKIFELLDDLSFERAVRELRLLASVQSPHVVAPVDAGHAKRHLFYAFRLPERGTLATSAVPLSRAARIAAVADAARGAHDLHEHGIVHRNIKPGTIFLGPEHAMLGDVGLAAPLGAERSVLGPLGAAEFTDPLVLRGGQASRGTDVYSLGMALRWAITEASALPGDRSEVSLIKHAVRREAAGLSLLQAEESAIVKACVDPDRAKRPATAAELADHLDRLCLLEEETIAESEPLPPSEPSSGEETGRIW